MFKPVSGQDRCSPSAEGWWRCRQVFWENYSKAANDAAQSLALRRNKEAGVRELFRKAVARLIPVQVLTLSSSRLLSRQLSFSRTVVSPCCLALSFSMPCFAKLPAHIILGSHTLHAQTDSGVIFLQLCDE